MALCYLLVLYCFIRGLEGRARVWHPLAVAACLAGVLCKEDAATVPLMLLIYDRTFISGTFQAAWRAHGRLYLALAASWLVLVPLLLDVGQRGVGFHLGALTVAAIAVTVQRNHDYRDAVGLWADTVAKSPGNHRAHGFLANLLARLPGRHEEAIAHYKHALELRPDFAAAHHNLAIILARLPHRAEEARIHQEAARRLLSNPGTARPETTGKRDDLPPARNQNQ